MTHANALLVIAKRPAAGQTKTRLCPPLLPDQAAALYECLLADTLDLTRRVPDVDRGILYLPSGARPYFAELARDFALWRQEGASLGERLDNALSSYLLRGYERVVIMNSDGPTLPVEHIHEAFARLRAGAAAVFGPSEDGGYYLIGATRPVPQLLRGVRMSRATTLTETLARAREEGLAVELLPEWYDIDLPADLLRLERELDGTPITVAPRTRAWLSAAHILKLAS